MWIIKKSNLNIIHCDCWLCVSIGPFVLDERSSSNPAQCDGECSQHSTKQGIPQKPKIVTLEFKWG